MSRLIFKARTEDEAERLDRWLTLSDFSADRNGQYFEFDEAPETIGALEMTLAPLFASLRIDGYFDSKNE
jgi:hypothetical protein